MPAFSIGPFVRTLVVIGAAFFQGLAIGFERQWRQRTAGLRPNVLVARSARRRSPSLGCVCMVRKGATRIIAYVVSGIGFLGRESSCWPYVGCCFSYMFLAALEFWEKIMAADIEAAKINAQAIQIMLDLPKLYGPNGFDGTAGPPADLVAVLMQLETATVDPTLLTGNQTVASVETQTLTDLQGISDTTSIELLAASRPIGNIGREQLAFDRLKYPGEVADLQANAKLFTAGVKPPITIVDPPPPPASGAEQYQVTNTSTGVADWENGSVYSGPVLNIQNQFITLTTDSINVTATKLNNFIHTGSGNDAIDVSFFGEAGGGTNVLDGGTGSNFLVGNFKGTDSFFVDDRAALSDIWSTVVNFRAGDAATVWGVTPRDFNLAWVDGQGAAGYTGLTLHAAQANRPNASLTLAGYAVADLQNGKLAVTFGNDPLSGSNYMLIQGR